MRRFPIVVLAVLVSGCSLSPPANSPRVAYRDAESVESLSVPPDLTRTKSSEALDVSEIGTGNGDKVVPDFENIRMVRAGPLQWIEVDDAAPDELWPRMSGFLRSEGLTIRTQRPAEGLIESAWAERFDGPPRSGLGGLFQTLLGGITSDNVHDKYQIRLERMDGGAGTRVFVNQWSAKEVNTNANTRDTGIYDMVRAEVDPAVSAEMRRRLLVYLGVSRERASAIAAGEEGMSSYVAPVRLVVTEAGVAYAEIEEPSYRRALGLVGEALRLAGADITETDEDNGTIRLRWLPPEELRDSGLFSDDRPRELMVRLESGEEAIRVVAADSDGTVRSGEVHVALLERMVDAMGGDTSGHRGVSDPEDDAAPVTRPSRGSAS